MSARAAFSRAMDILFKNMGRKALYKSSVSGEEKNVYIVFRMPDENFDIQDTIISSPSIVLEVRVSDVAAPKSGDNISFEGRIFTVQGEPMIDQHGLFWRLNTNEEIS